jgi:2-oxoglutarate ferredoxin oxidoreductase subunit alpha
MARETVNVMIGGEAGQGLVTIGNVLCKALIRAGYHIVVTQDYMSRIRGGHNTYTIRASARPIAAPTEGVDLLIALNQETADLHAGELTQGALVVGDEGISCGQAACFGVSYQDLTEGKYINTVALGVAGCLLGLPRDTVGEALGRQLGKKSDEVNQKNADALDQAYAHTKEHAPGFEPLSGGSDLGERLMLGGNEGIALGAMAAGLKFLSFYPMTPATSVALNVIGAAEKMGIVAEQAEDEIGAVNMAVGASFAGAPALVCTSGGGYALMTEGVSLAGMTETPLVIALIQRPGPATGLPTRTEQADLEFALYGGHGEFPRAVFAPGTVEQCFEHAYRAMHLAETFQTPVFVMGDEFLADSFRDVEPFDLSGLEPVRAGDPRAGEAGYDYLRYAITESGVSPRAIPGLGEYLVLADSDEHDEKGHIVEDAETRVAMNEKRLRKLAAMREQVVAPEFEGPEDAELMLVCWGSLRGAVWEAAQALREGGQSAAACHFSQVWPLRPDQFRERLGRAGRLVMVEQNATGQMAGLLRKEAGVDADRLITRYDGRPITPEYIQRKLAE